jgi:hypothetical protein
MVVIMACSAKSRQNAKTGVAGKTLHTYKKNDEIQVKSFNNKNKAVNNQFNDTLNSLGDHHPTIPPLK